MLRLKYERERQGLSQNKLSHKADVNATSLSRIERGLEPPYPKRAKRLADALGWKDDPMELFREVE